MATSKARDDRADVGTVRPEGVEDLLGLDRAGLDAVGQTPCQVLGEREIVVNTISVTRNDRLEWRMFVCNSPGLAVLRLMDSMGRTVSLVDQRVPPPNPIQRVAMPPTPPAGRYTLFWGLAPVDPTNWQTVAEVLVNGTVVFRHFKSSQSKEPFSKGFLNVVVV
ncbi:MAG TPA: hypothetical protein VLT87_04220 [Thermoanaerobaculia bacterium]|nr:hypothetical protein [Thermoanaerobaculia bacterium]